MEIKTRKVAIIGTGHVGSHVAFALATQGLVDELYMVDIDRKKAAAQAMDVNDAVSYLPHHVEAKACTVEECGDCDIMVISAGPLPEEQQDRLATLGLSIDVLKDIIPRIKKSGFQGIFVSITNPADVIAGYLQKELNYPAHKVMSTGTCLDSSRLQRIVSEHFNVGRKVVSIYSMGEHGGSAMVPWSHANIAGKSLDKVQKDMAHKFPKFDRDAAVQAMKDGGYQVLIGKGSTEFGIASSAAEIIRAVFHDERKLLPVSVYLDGQYGVKDVFASVPVVVGRKGVETIVEIDLTKEELDLFQYSCQVIDKHIKDALAM